MSYSAGVSRKAEDAYPTCAPGSCSQFFVEPELLMFCYFVYYFGYFMFFIVCDCFPCLVFVPGLHFFISARILVPLISLNIVTGLSHRNVKKSFYCLA